MFDGQIEDRDAVQVYLIKGRSSAQTPNIVNVGFSLFLNNKITHNGKSPNTSILNEDTKNNISDVVSISDNVKNEHGEGKTYIYDTFRNILYMVMVFTI